MESSASISNGSGKCFIVLFIVMLLDLISFASILPLFPAILDQYAQHASKGSFYRQIEDSLISFRQLIGAPNVTRFNSVLFGGFLGSLFCFLQFLCCPIFGAISDVFGRKRILLLSLIGSFTSYMLWAVSSTSFSLFVLSRVIGGISKISTTLSIAVVTDLSTPTTRGKGMALIGACFSFGFLIGPMTGAYFARQARINNLSSPTPAYIAMILTIIEAIVIIFLLPETLPVKSRQSSIVPVVRNSIDYVNPLALFHFRPVHNNGNISKSSLSTIQRIGLVYFSFMFLYSGLEFTLTFLTHLRFQYDSMQQGRMFLFIGAIMILVQGGYGRRIAVEKHKSAAMKGLLILIPAFLLIAYCESKLLFYLGLTFYSVASGIVVPCLTTMASGYGSDSEKGTVLGVFRSLGALARSIGPLVASAAFWTAGPVISYSIGAALMIVPCLLLKSVTPDIKSKIK